MDDEATADPHLSDTDDFTSATERGSPTPGSRSKAAALLDAFSEQPNAEGRKSPKPRTPSQTDPFRPINFGNTLTLPSRSRNEGAPDEVLQSHALDEAEVLKQLLHDANTEVVALRTALLSATTNQADAVSGVQSLSQENLALQDELVNCKAAIAQFEFQREKHRLELNAARKELKALREREGRWLEFEQRRHGGSNSSSPGRRSPWTLPAQGALSLATAITNRINISRPGRSSPGQQQQHPPAELPPPGDSGATSSAHDHVFSPVAGWRTADEPSTMRTPPRAVVPSRPMSARAAGLTLESIAHLSYERSMTKAAFESWGFKLSSKITSDGVWVHTMVDITPEGPADKAGLGRFGPGMEVLAGVNGTAMFGTDGDGVAKQMRSRSTLVQLTVVTNDDFADHLLSSMEEDETMPQLLLRPSATCQPPRPSDPIKEPVACGPSRIPHPSPPRPLHPPQQPSDQRPLQPPQQHSPQRPLQIPHHSLQRPLQPPRQPSAEQPLQQPLAELGPMLCGEGATEGAAATSVSVAMAVGDSGRHSEDTMRQHPAPEVPTDGEHHVQKSDDDDCDNGSRLSFL